MTRIARRHLAGALLVSVSLLSGCSGDSDSTALTATATSPASPTASLTPTSVASGSPTVAETFLPSETPPADLTGTDVCALVDSAMMGAALGADVEEPAASTTSTPQCSYVYTGADGVTTNVVLAVMRGSDVGDLTGAAAFDFAVGLNRLFAGEGATEDEVSGVGDRALFMTGAATKLLIVQVGPRIVTLAGSGLTGDTAAAIGTAAASSLE